MVENNIDVGQEVSLSLSLSSHLLSLLSIFSFSLGHAGKQRKMIHKGWYVLNLNTTTACASKLLGTG